MRVTLLAAAAAAALGLAFSQPASAGGWGEPGCCGERVFIHHHVYYPPRYMHVYHHHRPVGARHLNVVHYNACCGPRRAHYWRRYW